MSRSCGLGLLWKWHDVFAFLFQRAYWCDFNKVLAPSKKLGTNPRRQRLIDGFREYVSHCRFVDLGFNGNPFTWSNKRVHNYVATRLDWCLATPWCSLVLVYKVQYKADGFLDHMVILLMFISMSVSSSSHSPRPCPFKPFWLTHDNFETYFASLWSDVPLRDDSTICDHIHDVR